MGADELSVKRAFEWIHFKHRELANVASFGLYLGVYLLILYYQSNSYVSFQISRSHMTFLPSNYDITKGNYFAQPSDLYSWLNSSLIQTIWQDGTCGDGICQPYETAAYGPNDSYGCAADCGVFTNVTNVTVTLYTDFRTVAEQEAATWNLCLANFTFCWFSAQQPFSGPLNGLFESHLNLLDGNWTVRVTDPNSRVSKYCLSFAGYNACDTNKGYIFSLSNFPEVSNPLFVLTGMNQVSRSVNGENTILVGLLLQQERQNRSCVSSVKRFDNLCSSSENYTPSHFGINPVFLLSSSIYDSAFVSSLENATGYSSLSALQNTPPTNGFNEIVQGGNSYGFQYFFDASMTNADATNLMTYIADGYFIDQFTTAVYVRLATYNAARGILTSFEVKVEPDAGGVLLYTADITSVKADHCVACAPHDFARDTSVVLPLFWFLFWSDAIFELKECIHKVHAWVAAPFLIFTASVGISFASLAIDLAIGSNKAIYLVYLVPSAIIWTIVLVLTWKLNTERVEDLKGGLRAGVVGLAVLILGVVIAVSIFQPGQGLSIRLLIILSTFGVTILMGGVRRQWVDRKDTLDIEDKIMFVICVSLAACAVVYAFLSEVELFVHAGQSSVMAATLATSAGAAVIATLVVVFLFKDMDFPTWSDMSPYFLDYWNYIDIMSIVIILLGLVWWHLDIIIDERKLNVLGNYHLYKVPLQASNYWKLADNSDIGSAIDLFESVKALIESQKYYFSIQGINIVFMVLRFLRTMSSNLYLGTIVNTFYHSLRPLLPFSVVLTTLYVVFALMAYITFGQELDEFRSFQESLSTCLFILFGRDGSFNRLFALNGWQKVAAVIFWISYVMMIGVLVLNVLIAIILDAYQIAKVGPVAGVDFDLYSLPRNPTASKSRRTHRTDMSPDRHSPDLTSQGTHATHGAHGKDGFRTETMGELMNKLLPAATDPTVGDLMAKIHAILDENHTRTTQAVLYVLQRSVQSHENGKAVTGEQSAADGPPEIRVPTPRRVAWKLDKDLES